LLPSIKLESSTHTYSWSEQPVVWRKSSTALIASRVEANVVLSVAAVSKTPSVAVAIGVINHPTLIELCLISIQWEVPKLVHQSWIYPRTPTEVPSSVVLAGNPSESSASAINRNCIGSQVGRNNWSCWVVNNQVNSVVRATERYYELIAYARDELKVVVAAWD
jgi:hypothetical protein